VAGGAGPDAKALGTEGVILFNAGKTTEALAKFEQAVKADANYAFRPISITESLF